MPRGLRVHTEAGIFHVGLATGTVTGLDTPPPHVLWGDIPTPMF